MKRIPLAVPVLGAKEHANVNDCVRSGWISSRGPYIEKFETAFAKYVGTKQAISTCNGTVSLHLILLGMGIGKGDEVIVPTFTYVASLNAILYIGATPVLVDCDATTYMMNPEEVAKKITKRTKAIMVVHLYGNMCDMSALEKISRKHGVPIVEDAAEAHGATYGKRMAGSFGVASSFSFFGNKTITTGEGGMICTNSKPLAARMRILKNQGQSPTQRYHHTVLGYNYRMTNIEAAIGLAQMESIDAFVMKKRTLRAWYEEALADLHNVGHIRFQAETPNSLSSSWMIALTIKGVSPKVIARELEKKQIETRPFFAPMHRLPYLTRVRGSYPNAERIHRAGLILPSALTLTQKDVELVSDQFRRAFMRHARA